MLVVPSRAFALSPLRLRAPMRSFWILEEPRKAQHCPESFLTSFSFSDPHTCDKVSPLVALCCLSSVLLVFSQASL